MRDAAGDIRPGGSALGPNQIGVVVERDDGAFGGAAFRGHLHAQGSRRTGALDDHLTACPAHRLGHGAQDQRRQFRHAFGIVIALQVFGRRIEQPGGGAVDQRDAPFVIDADHARADARQHRFGEAAAGIHQLAGRQQVGALGRQLLGHAVEGDAQRRQLVIVAFHPHLGIEIAFRNPARRVNQA